MTDRFEIGGAGREVGIIDTQKDVIAVFHGSDPVDLRRRLEFAVTGLNDGTITTRDWVWDKTSDVADRPKLGHEGEQS